MALGQLAQRWQTGTVLGKRTRNLSKSQRSNAILEVEKSSQSSMSESDYDLSSDNESAQDSFLTPLTPASRTSTPSTSIIYPCTFESCPKTFNRNSRLQEHIRSHKNIRPFRCSVETCEKAFFRRSHLSHHIKSAHTNERNFICNWHDCGKAFHNGSRLRRHKATHEDRERYRCRDYPPCDSTFRKHATLQKHIGIVHLNRKPFICTYADETTQEHCNKGFVSETTLNAHQAREHSKQRYWCSLCATTSTCDAETIEQEFATAADLQKHMNRAHPPRCAECGGMYSNIQGLKRHIEIHHSGKSVQDRKNIVCDEPGCDKAFTKRNNLNAHRRSAHANMKPFACGKTDLRTSKGIENWDGHNACGNTFTAKHSLEAHVRRQHLSISDGSRIQRKSTKTRTKKSERRMIKSLITGLDINDNTKQSLPCLSSGCELDFATRALLREHVSKNHGVNQEDMDDLLQEHEALNGGIFWLSQDEEGFCSDEGVQTPIDPRIM